MKIKGKHYALGAYKRNAYKDGGYQKGGSDEINWYRIGAILNDDEYQDNQGKIYKVPKKLFFSPDGEIESILFEFFVTSF